MRVENKSCRKQIIIVEPIISMYQINFKLYDRKQC